MPCNSSSKNTGSLKKIAFKFAVLFFMELELYKKLVAVFLELKFLELEFQKNYKFLIILQTVVDRQIFSLKMVFSYFGHLRAFSSGVPNAKYLAFGTPNTTVRAS